jgi:hypothetical protein
VLLLGSVSIAQQRVVLWDSPEAPPAVATAVASAPVPGAGVPQVDVLVPWNHRGASSAAPAASLSASAGCAPHKWSPPIISLTVDPWTTRKIVTRPTWVPNHVEVVEPWAASSDAPPAAAAPELATAPRIGRSAIF